MTQRGLFGQNRAPLARAHLLLLAGLVLSAAQDFAQAADSIQGIHVRRQGVMPEQRQRDMATIKAHQTSCGTPETIERCKIFLATPGITPQMRAHCEDTMLPLRIIGDPNRLGQATIDEYFAPALNRSTRVIRRAVLNKVKMCEFRVEEDEGRLIKQHRPDGQTLLERQKDKQGQLYWVQTEQQYSPGLTELLKSAYLPAQLSGKLSVSAPLGSKTLAPARPCEIRRVSAGKTDFVSCIHTTGLKFPSHLIFESQVTADGKTEAVEHLVAYTHDVALSRDIFFPRSSEKIVKDRDIRADANNPTAKWCAAQKARTGIDPCKDGDDDD